MFFRFSAILAVVTAGFLFAAEDERPVVDAAEVPVEKSANAKLPTFHIVGDSTVRSGGKDGMWGWGERIAPFFDASRIHVVNHAMGGRSARTFFNEGRWQKVADAIKPGDFVIIQFGHNDQGRIGDPANKGRADGPGIGDETVEDTKSDGSKELVHTFGWYMAKFVSDARAKKATVILCSPIPHKQRWEHSRDFQDVAKWGEQVAKAQGAHYFDLTQLITDAYRKAGKEQVETFFADKGTHTSDAGARFNAARVIDGLKGLQGQPLNGYLADGPAIPMRFSFGDRAMAGFTRVEADDTYSAALGYGFEAASAGGSSNSYSDGNTFQFSVKVAEGNYAVKMTFGGAGSVTTVKAEQRRLMLEKIRGQDGAEVAQTFVVNVRTPAIAGGSRVILKDRELQNEALNWDDKLTLEMNGVRPSLQSMEITPVKVPTIFITGDSTVCDQPAEPWGSWGQMLPRFFGPDVAVANYAQSGESIRSSLGANRFGKVFSHMKAGDYLLMQFGHNDQKDKSPDALATYKSNLKTLVARGRSLGATPVLVTPMERKSGLMNDTLGGYPDAVRALAVEEKCAMIDLHALSRVLYKALGPDLDKAFQDGTHHSNYGSYELAQCVVVGMKGAKLPVTKFVATGFTFDPSKPDPAATFNLPPSTTVSAEKPLGN